MTVYLVPLLKVGNGQRIKSRDTDLEDLICRRLAPGPQMTTKLRTEYGRTAVWGSRRSPRTAWGSTVDGVNFQAGRT